MKKIAFRAFLLSGLAALAFPLQAQTKVLFIGGADDEPTSGTDQIVFDHLEEKYGVGNVTYMSANQSDGSEAEDVDLVIMSSTFGSGSARGKFHETTTPVLQWEEALVQVQDGNWPFTQGAKTKSVEESFVILNLEHPIITAGSDLHAGGLPVNEIGDEYQIFEDGGGNTWSAAGPLPEDAVILAETPTQYDPGLPIEESGACLFLVETGGTLYDSGGDPFVAAGPSLHFAMEDNSPGSFNDNGWDLFDRCLDWLTGDLVGTDPTLVGWYTFDDGAGDTVADSSGKGYDGEVFGSDPEWVAEGKVGGALFLPGVDEFVEIADTDDHEFAEGEPFSVALWVKSDIDDNDNGLVTKGYHDGSRDNNYWMLQTLGEGFGFDSRCCDGGGTPRIKPEAGGDSDDDEWRHVAVVRDIDSGEFRLYLDGEETGNLEMEIDGGDWDMGVNEDPTVIGNHFDRFTPSFFDDLGIWRRALSEDEILEIFENGIASIAGGVSAPDTDGDGMPDDYEDENGLDKNVNDADLDKDGDGLTNIEEFNLKTKPNVADTDEDGLNDNVETNTEVWVSAADTGTNPLRADTDKDGLRDGAETNTGVFVDANNTGTHPLVSDTDGDGAADGLEVAGGTNPLDASSVVSNQVGGGVFTVEHLWTDGLDQIGDAFTAEDFLNAPSEDYQVITVESKWIHFHDNAAPPWFGDESVPYPLWADDGFGARDDFAIRARGQINIRSAGTATFVVNSDDGFVLRIDGDDVGEAGNRGRGNTVIEVDLTAGLHELEFIHWERGGGAGVTVTIYRGTGQAPGPDGDNFELLQAFGGGAAPFEMIDVAYTGGDAPKLSATWSSNPGESFTVETSTDLIEWLELTDGLESGGATTSFETNLPAPDTPKETYIRARKEG